MYAGAVFVPYASAVHQLQIRGRVRKRRSADPHSSVSVSCAGAGVPWNFRSHDRLGYPIKRRAPCITLSRSTAKTQDCVGLLHYATNACPLPARTTETYLFRKLLAPIESMSSETYVYDESTGSTILSKIKTKTDFLHLPSKDVKSRDWEKEKKQLISYDLHCATLGEYHRQARIPRGLRCNLRPTLFSDNEKYCATFQKILNKCSFDIILLTIEYLQEAIKSTEEKIESIETQLTATLNTTELSTLKNKIDASLISYQRSLEERKRTKYQRDAEDYSSNKVYRWEDTAPRRPRSRYRRTPGGNYPSGGSSPAGGSSAGSGSETGGAQAIGPQLKVLNMGLSFCPTPKWDSFQLERDLQRFYRNIRLKVHFNELPYTGVNRLGTTSSQSEEAGITLGSLGLRNPSSFVPPKSNHAVETFIDLLDRDIRRTIHEQRLGLLPVRHNLSSSEKQALDTLSENRDIVIKPADKGGAIVIMNKHHYVTEIRRQLSDTNTYRKLQGDPTYSIQRKISTVIDKYMSLGTIDSKTKTYLTNHHPVTPVLYILPKIHKNLQNPPGRPIVASTDSVLNPLSKFLEKILTPYTKLTKSFILDTSDFLSKIRNISNIPPDSLLCTLDVNSLYTSITHDRGVTAVSLTLQEVGIDRNTHDLCLDLLNLVLRENFFLFEDDFFVQTCGTAMGSNVAPAYANLYMDHFEREHVYANPIFQQNALVWYRYIDDIFCIWQGNHTSLQGFYDAINTTLPELTFTLTHHDSEITFLDTKVLKNPLGQLTFCTTNLFGKRVLDAFLPKNQRLQDLAVTSQLVIGRASGHMGGRATNHKPRRHRKVLQALILRKEGSRLVPGRVRGGLALRIYQIRCGKIRRGPEYVCTYRNPNPNPTPNPYP
ncbi:unnamed protein product [Ranitomeya imitator]|uniref:Reverse transcriptase domain-containing protein n=1 Tax=Ranitomeya imitator TaxID=111125 RepID=A0ABN9MT14_9NEOB|nr:unnamed protein product [Ranitomeya imitator]